MKFKLACTSLALVLAGCAQTPSQPVVSDVAKPLPARTNASEVNASLNFIVCSCSLGGPARCYGQVQPCTARGFPSALVNSLTGLETLSYRHGG